MPSLRCSLDGHGYGDTHNPNRALKKSWRDAIHPTIHQQLELETCLRQFLNLELDNRRKSLQLPSLLRTDNTGDEKGLLRGRTILACSISCTILSISSFW